MIFGVFGIGPGYGRERSLPVQTKPGIDPFRVEISGKMLGDVIMGSNKEHGEGTEGSDTGNLGGTTQSYVFTGNFLRNWIASGTPLDDHNGRCSMNVNNAKLSIKALKQVKDFVYAFVLELTGDTNSSRAVREAYVEIESKKLGVLKLGNTGDPVRKLGEGPYFDVGSGGTDGNFNRFVTMTTACAPVPFFCGDTREATKAVYISPPMSGFQLSLSFTPNSHLYGEAPMNTAFSPLKKPLFPFDLNVIQVGARYEFAFKEVKFALSSSYLTGSSRPEKPDVPLLERTKRTKSWNAAFTLSAGPWSIGGEYIYNGRSHQFANNLPSVTPTVNGKQWMPKIYLAGKAGKHKVMHAGIKYSTDVGGVAFSYLYTTRYTGFVPSLDNPISGKAIGRAYVLSSQYNLAPGIAPYIEGAIYSMKNPDWAYLGSAISSLTGWEVVAVPSSRSQVILAGIKIQF